MSDEISQSMQVADLLNNSSKEYLDQTLQNQDISQTINNLNDTNNRSSILKASFDSSLLHIKPFYKRVTSPRLSPLKKPRFYQWVFLNEDKKKELENEEIKEKEVQTQIDKSFEIDIEDSKPKDHIGDKAIGAYYQHYKRLKKVQDQNNLKYLPLNYNLTKGSFNFLHFSLFLRQKFFQNQLSQLYYQKVKLLWCYLAKLA